MARRNGEKMMWKAIIQQIMKHEEMVKFFKEDHNSRVFKVFLVMEKNFCTKKW